MSQYVVSARKYRPNSFESLIGQDNIARTLKNSIQRGQIAHAYLFCGPRGVGKTSTARIFAKAINCAHPSENMEPCCECESCVSFQEGRSYCIHELDAASNNGIDDMRALLDQVQIPPQVGRYSVFIIDEVHMLSQQAFNAFLKTLEEPPAHAIFILATTEKHKILPTVLSRCQTYDFNRISISDIVGNLRSIASAEGITVDDESLHVIAQKADGAMRDALTIFDQTVAFCGTEIRYADVVRNLNVLDYDYSFRLVDAFLTGDYATALLIFDEILSKGFNALHFMSALSSHLRDLVVSRTAGLESLLDLPASLKARYAGQAERCPLDFLYNALNVTSQCEMGFKTSSNQRLHIEFALMKLAFLLNPPAPSARPATPAPAPDQKPSAPVAQAPAAPVATTPTPEPPTPAVPEPAKHQPIAFELDEPAVTVPAPEEKNPAPQEKKPVPEEKATPTRRRRPGITLSSMMQESAAAEPAASESTDDDAIPTEDSLRKAWKEMSGEYASRPRLAVAMSGANLRFAEADGRCEMTFEVTNEAQQKWIQENLLTELETKLQTRCGSRRLKLLVEAAEVVTVRENYLPSEKARALMEQNPEVKNLVIDLGLDTK